MSPPRFVAFARAIALVSVTAAPISGCCPMMPESVVCAHCACDTASRSLSAPLLCDTIGRDEACCVPAWLRTPVVGPLEPPDLVG